MENKVMTVEVYNYLKSIDLLTNGIEECKKTISDLRKEKAKLIDEHKETLMKSDKENSTRINDLNKALSGKIEELEKLKGRKFSIDRELEISNQKCSSLQKRLDSADESNRTLVSQKQELLRKNSSLDNEVLSLRRANEEYLIEIETLEALLDAKTEGLDLLNTTLTADILKKEEAIKGLESKLKSQAPVVTTDNLKLVSTPIEVQPSVDETINHLLQEHNGKVPESLLFDIKGITFNTDGLVKLAYGNLLKLKRNFLNPTYSIIN